MKRRAFIAFLGGAATVPLAWPPAARAQRVPHVGVLRPFGSPASDQAVEALRAGLHDLGYDEGRNIVLDIRYSGNRPELLPALAAELAALKVNVIVTYGPAGTKAAKEASSTIPIVMGRMDDADAQGFVASLSHPGGNITGVSFQSGDLATKWFELLKEVLPPGARIAALWDSASTVNQTRLIEAAAHTVGVDLFRIDVREPGDFQSALETARKEGAKGIVLLASPMITGGMSKIAGIAAAQGLAAIYVYSAFARAGGLIGYGPSEADPSFSYRRAAFYVDKILKGGNPADIPVEQPTRFEFTINLKVAKTLGITIPATMLGRADEVIE
jgi:putative ABC transport system substrate-binding protein